MEVWKDIPNYCGVYKVSNLGKVKSLKYGKERILKPGDTEKGYKIGKGYPSVILSKKNKRKTFKVHTLVALCFLNYNLKSKKMINHIDENPQNNNVDNLEIVTNRQNIIHSIKDKTSKYTGVSWAKEKNKWVAQIGINRKTYFLGRYNNEYEAHLAYQNALKNLANE